MVLRRNRLKAIWLLKSKWMVKLVEQMLSLHEQAAARTPQEKTTIDRQIAATDAPIDRLVYDLYGLTEEEIEIVEKRG